MENWAIPFQGRNLGGTNIINGGAQRGSTGVSGGTGRGLLGTFWGPNLFGPPPGVPGTQTGKFPQFSIPGSVGPLILFIKNASGTQKGTGAKPFPTRATGGCKKKGPNFFPKKGHFPQGKFSEVLPPQDRGNLGEHPFPQAPGKFQLWFCDKTPLWRGGFTQRAWTKRGLHPLGGEHTRGETPLVPAFNPPPCGFPTTFSPRGGRAHHDSALLGQQKHCVFHPGEKKNAPPRSRPPKKPPSQLRVRPVPTNKWGGPNTGGARQRSPHPLIGTGLLSNTQPTTNERSLHRGATPHYRG